MIRRVNEKNIVTSIILTIVTCGIYGIVWFIEITDSCADASGDHSMSGTTSLLFNILTCGIYSIYWNYKMGKLLAIAQEKRNLPVTDNSTLYLVLSIFSMGIISTVLIQSELNRLAVFDHPNNAK